MSKYESFEDANGDIGRVMDEIRDIEGVRGVELRDTDHKQVSGGEIAWSDIRLNVSVRASKGSDE